MKPVEKNHMPICVAAQHLSEEIAQDKGVRYSNIIKPEGELLFFY